VRQPLEENSSCCHECAQGERCAAKIEKEMRQLTAPLVPQLDSRPRSQPFKLAVQQAVQLFCKENGVCNSLCSWMLNQKFAKD